MYLWIFIAGIFFAFYNAWGGGANDCANSFATAVGSKTLTLKQAILIASVFEFTGAVLMGSHVTDAVRKNIVSEDLFTSNPGALMFGMLCADLASALWLTFATYFKYPVSTTHSIIGAIIGFSLAYGGGDAISWNKVGLIVASWFASPIIAGLFSLIIFTLVKKLVFQSNDPFNRTAKLFPLLTFITFFINSLFIIYKGSPQLDLDEMPFEVCFGISVGIASGTGLISWYFYLPYAKKKLELMYKEETTGENTMENTGNNIEMRTLSYSDALTQKTINPELETESNTDTIDIDICIENEQEDTESIDYHKKRIRELENKKKTDKINELHSNAYEIDEKSDKLCSWLQIFTSCFSSFAHGSNDVANAIAPLATIFSIYQYNEILETADVPIWILALGGVGIVVGLATWGYKIIDRIGKELTKVSPSRGFIIELSAAMTVIIASRTELPVSTTHCQVGSVVGCGLSEGKNNVQWKLLKGILWSWFITLPVTGLLSAGLFSYGFYAPSPFSSNVTYIE